MKKEDVGRVLGCEGEGAEGGKVLERAVEGHLRIKQEPGIELDRVVLSAVVPTEDPAVLQYAIVEDENRSDCITVGLDDFNVEEINKVEVRDILKDLADLKRQEDECLDKLSEAVPDMKDSDVTIFVEKVWGDGLPKCIYDKFH